MKGRSLETLSTAPPWGTTELSTPSLPGQGICSGQTKRSPCPQEPLHQRDRQNPGSAVTKDWCPQPNFKLAMYQLGPMQKFCLRLDDQIRRHSAALADPFNERPNDCESRLAENSVQVRTRSAPPDAAGRGGRRLAPGISSCRLSRLLSLPSMKSARSRPAAAPRVIGETSFVKTA